MKITGFQLYELPPRWLFLKLETDEGIDGWGEPVVEGRSGTVKACVEELAEYFIGKDPRRIEDMWQVLYRGGFYRGGPVLTSALSGIEQAMWDIKGKYYNMPVYEFLGGACRNSIETYSWIGGDTPEDVVRGALKQKENGFRAIKMNGTGKMKFIDKNSVIDEVVERVAGVREACGKNFGIAVDFHGRIHKGMAKRLIKELEPYNLMFIEEPVLSENYEALKYIAGNTATPIALGERLYTRWDYKKIFEQGIVDIIQPDPSHAGGILEVRKIAAVAETYDMAVAPHSPLGPIALAAALQIDACTPNAVVQEQSLGIHYNKENDLLDYLENKELFEYKDGMLAIPDAPGLGVKINEDYVKERVKEYKGWKNPVWRNDDGTVAEW